MRPAKMKGLKEYVAGAVESGRLRYSNHANQRMNERKIIKPEVEHILSKGYHEAKKDQFKEEHESWDYAFSGKTLDGRRLRVVVAIVEPNVLVVTAIDLESRD